MSGPTAHAPTAVKAVPSECLLDNWKKVGGVGSQRRIEDGEEGDFPMNGCSAPRTQTAGAEVMTGCATPRANASFTKVVTAKGTLQTHGFNLSVRRLRRWSLKGDQCDSPCECRRTRTLSISGGAAAPPAECPCYLSSVAQLLVKNRSTKARGRQTVMP